MLRRFQDSFIFGEATSSHFFRVSSTQKLLFGSSYFFRAATFLRSSFFRTVTFSQQLVFSESAEQPFLENRKFFTGVTFWNSYPFGGGIIQNKDIQGKTAFSKQVLLHSINFFRKARFWEILIFHKSNIPHYLLFYGELPFQSGCRFKRCYLVQQLPFQKGYFFSQHTFSEEILFHSHAFFPQILFPYIS